MEPIRVSPADIKKMHVALRAAEDALDILNSVGKASLRSGAIRLTSPYDDYIVLHLRVTKCEIAALLNGLRDNLLLQVSDAGVATEELEKKFPEFANEPKED